MNPDYFPFPSLFIPRSDSLLHRLQHAPAPPDKEALPYLDQLMILLDDPPPDVRDRWKQGAKMCSEWGFSCSSPTIWRLYRSFALEWRHRLAHEARSATPDASESLEDEIASLAERRTFEALSNPNLSTEAASRFIRIELRRQSLQLARLRHQENQRESEQIALDLYHKEIGTNRVARELFTKLQFAIDYGSDPDRDPRYGQKN